MMVRKKVRSMANYYIDVGSSTTKVHKYENKKLVLLEEHSIYFKNDFSEESGISKENKQTFYDYFLKLKEEYNLTYTNTHIYATGIFRNLKDKHKNELINHFNDEFNLHFHIISHGIENYYLGKAMDNDYNNQKVMIINMGGKTTELITFENNEITNRVNLNIGVGDLLKRFPEVNNQKSGVTIEEVNNFVKEQINDIKFDQDYVCAIFTGGEERFQKLTKFNLGENILFKDGIHKYMIHYKDYIKGTADVFFEYSLDELYSLMPGNPKWMDGARAGAVLPMAIFDKAKIKYIVPSDLNLINGVINDLE